MTRPGDKIQRWYCADCRCEHEASVLGGPAEHHHDGLTELQRAVMDHDKDMVRLDRNRLVVPPLEQSPLQSLKEVESTRAEEEDYEHSGY